MSVRFHCRVCARRERKMNLLPFTKEWALSLSTLNINTGNNKSFLITYERSLRLVHPSSHYKFISYNVEEQRTLFRSVNSRLLVSPCRCFPSNVSQQIFFSQQTLSGHVKRGLVRTKSGRVHTASERLDIFGYITDSSAQEKTTKRLKSD